MPKGNPAGYLPNVKKSKGRKSSKPFKSKKGDCDCGPPKFGKGKGGRPF